MGVVLNMPELAVRRSAPASTSKRYYVGQAGLMRRRCTCESTGQVESARNFRIMLPSARLSDRYDSSSNHVFQVCSATSPAMGGTELEQAVWGSLASSSAITGIMIVALTKLFISCAIATAAVPAQERDGTVKVLSKLAYRLLLPALLFTETAKIAAGQTLLALIPVLVIATLHVMIGAAVGSATARLCGLRDKGEQRPTFRNAVLASTFGNATTLPFLILGSLSVTYQPLSAIPGSLPYAIGLASLYNLAWGIALWTVGLRYVNEPEPQSAVESLWIDERDDPSPKELHIRPRLELLSRLQQVLHSKMVKQLLTPPTLGSLLGLTAGFPPVAAALFGPSSPFVPLRDAVKFFGVGCQPVLAIVLALSLTSSAGQTKTSDQILTNVTEKNQMQLNELEVQWVCSTVLARGIFVPLLGGGLVILAESLGWLPPADPVYKLVLLMETVMPSAQVLVLLAQLAREERDDGGSQAGQVARLLFMQYGVMTVPITFWMSWFLAYAL